MILAIPAFFLAYFVFRLPEPVRGAARGRSSGARTDRRAGARRRPSPTRNQGTDAQRLALSGTSPRPPAGRAKARSVAWGSSAAGRYVLHVRTNVALIISGACGYYFLAGVQTFGVEFVARAVPRQSGAGEPADAGGGGRAQRRASWSRGRSATDGSRSGHLKGRIQVAAVAAVAVVALFIPALSPTARSPRLPYIILAGAALSAQNPPIDAARLDIVPAFLWGRAEGIRTFVRTGAQALAPLLFGAVSDLLSGNHPNSGLRWTFVIMLAAVERERPLPVSGDADLSDRCGRRLGGVTGHHGSAAAATHGRGTRAGVDASPDPGY